MIRTQVKQKIIEALEKVYPEHKKVPFNIFEPSADIEADLCTNLAMLLAQVMGYPPVQIAHRICEHLTPGSLIQSMAVSHHGYINIRLNPEFLYRFLSGICSGQHSFLHPTLDSHKPKVLIEFVSANPTGPLHIGHGRGAALGDCLARIYRQLGYGVDTEYYINDVGVQMQILAQSVGARYAQLESGNASHPFPENGYQGKYIEDIATIMRDRKQNNFDSFPKDYILDWIRKDLALFGVEFTQWFSEKTLYEQKKIDAILDLLRSKNSLKEKEGALWFVPPGSKEQGRTDPDRVLRKSDGSYTYFTSDIAYHQNKFERGYEYCIDIWGHDHHGYVPRVELALQTLGHSKDRLKLLLYQLVSLKWGGKRIAMSTRAGQFITLRTIIEEVGVDACRFFFAMRSPNAQLEFDVDLAKKQSNENPVYYVQYVHARICSIFREAQKRNIPLPDFVGANAAASTGQALGSLPGMAFAPEELELMKKLAFFEETLDYALQLASPHVLTTYLIECATKFHKFYDQHRVLEAPSQIRDFRFLLLKATQRIIALGLELLGVSAPEKM